jgi:hypothetical protein
LSPVWQLQLLHIKVLSNLGQHQAAAQLRAQCFSAVAGTAEGWAEVLSSGSTGMGYGLARDLATQLATTLLDVAVAIVDAGEPSRQGSPSDTGRFACGTISELGRAMPTTTMPDALLNWPW